MNIASLKINENNLKKKENDENPYVQGRKNNDDPCQQNTNPHAKAQLSLLSLSTEVVAQ